MSAKAELRLSSADLSKSAALQKGAIPALFVALALLVTTGYGSGVQLNDGQASLHIDPLKFLAGLLPAWSPALHLGGHTGFLFPYETPYAWGYGIAQILHLPQDIAQHTIVFGVYLACLFSMYYCLRSVTPWIDEIARIAGCCAYLFNMYVALNSQAQVIWLLTYLTLPAMVGVTARAMRGDLNVWRAGLFVGLLVLVGAGINPPLVAINVIILAIFVVIAIVFDPAPTAAARRTWPFLAIALTAAITINLYWLVPFVDYFRGVYLNGVLSEAPSMHNAATSFANVLRGLGHWATFVSFGGHAYFPWAAPYAAGLFGALLWFVPIVALAAIAFKRNQRPSTLFFLIVTIVSIPIVVGYYHDELGDAVTTPIYNAFYRNFPGFQMFRFSYKWVAGVEFGLSGLYAISVAAIIASLRERFGATAGQARRQWSWIVPAAAAALVVMPIVVFFPVLTRKMNYPGPIIPAWEYREKALTGQDQLHRVALFPTQYLEQFDWGSPEFYIEDSLVDRPMIYGLLGSEPSEGTDVWVRRSYRAAREGLPFAADMLRVLGVDTILQRDDFVPAIDFSSPGESRFNTTTLTHDLLHRVIGASPARSDGPLRVYHVNGALPLIYGVTHPVVSTVPTFTDGYLGDVAAMASGRAQFDPPTRSTDEFSSALQLVAPILPASDEQVRDLAVNQALAHGGIRIHPPSADVGWTTPFQLRDGGVYEIFSLEQSLLFERTPAQNLQIDGNYFSPLTTGGAWTQYGRIELAAGKHSLSDGYPDPDLVVALVNVDDLKAWEDRITALIHASPNNVASTNLVYASKTTVTLPKSGRYRVSVGAVGPFGPDGEARTQFARGGAYRGSFPVALGATLPYIPGSGIIGTAPVMMPAKWYTSDVNAYQWQRGDPTSWLLFSRDAHLRIFVPGAGAVRARVSLRISRLQVANTMSVSINGGTSQDVPLPGPSAAGEIYDTTTKLDGPTPTPVSFTTTLQSGWNDLMLRFHPLGAKGSELGGSGTIAAAVAPDLAVVRLGAAGSSARSQHDATFRALGVATPADILTADPELLGSAEGVTGHPAWLAVALRDRGNVIYRLYPIAQDGTFDINFMHAFPNDWYDGDQRFAGMWFLSRAARSKFSALYYTLHAMPARALRHPASLTTLPIRIDGRRVGAGPIYLNAGRHVVASADPQLKITLLSIAPVKLPRTQNFGLTWQRPSPTALNVTAKSTGNPFLLVFGEAYHPEWEATLNGTQPLAHVMVDGVVNGWIVPSLPDGGVISLRFAGRSYYLIAALVSLIALILMIVLASAPQLWPIRSSDP